MSGVPEPLPLDRATIDQIVERVFRARTSTLQHEAEGVARRRLLVSSRALRARLVAMTCTLPEAAFTPAPVPEPGEAGWAAGQLVSHNADRLLWVLGHADRTVGGAELPSPAPVLVAGASEPPLMLTRAQSLAVVTAAEAYAATALPALVAADDDRRMAGTHHGEMGLAGWLLLLVIHDDDHLGQLIDRQALTKHN